jgi:hypothetical protein
MPSEMTAISPDVRKVPAPLVIGVTGHRDLRPEDLDRLGQQVRDVLRELRARYASTPFVLLSPLAEGADRLAARIALEPDIGARLVVPLPMARRLYEKDFQSPESLADFRELLKGAAHSFEIRMLASENEVSHAGAARNRQYEEVGKYIAGESQILIALWDGTRSDKVGGTAEIVEFQLRGIQGGSDCNLQPPELFPVYHIVTPRQSNPHPAGEPFQLIKKYPDGFDGEAHAQTYYDTIFRNLDDFNSCILKGGSGLIAAATQSKEELLGEFDPANLSEAETLEVDRYAVADALARRFQRQMLRLHRALHWLVFAAFLCLVLFAHLTQHPTMLLDSSFIVLGLGYLWHKRSSRIRLDTRNQDYRAVAEGSRVRFFWHFAGIHESVADNYLGKQRTELDWIRNGLRGWGIGPIGVHQTGGLSLGDRIEWVQKLWVRDQIRYFHRSTRRNENELSNMELLVRSCVRLVVLIGLGMLVAAVVIQFRHQGEWKLEDYEWIAWPIIALDCFLGAGALLHHATQQRAYAEHIKQFGRMETVFRRAEQAIHQKLQTQDTAGAQRCLLKLGQEALSENGDWVLLHRERPLELPHP